MNKTNSTKLINLYTKLIVYKYYFKYKLGKTLRIDKIISTNKKEL